MPGDWLNSSSMPWLTCLAIAAISGLIEAGIGSSSSGNQVSNRAWCVLMIAGSIVDVEAPCAVLMRNPPVKLLEIRAALLPHYVCNEQRFRWAFSLSVADLDHNPSNSMAEVLFF